MTYKTQMKFLKLLLYTWLLACSGCMTVSAEDQKLISVQREPTDSSKEIAITEDSFVCLKKMKPVRGFFVANLLGNLDDTVTAAMAAEGMTYPPGSVVQLIPAEVMVKHHRGWSEKTNDWEFFELDVSKKGSKIKVRGTTQVINKFGGNCLACHRQAKPQWDLICEQDHGCDPLPIPDFIIRWTQRTDPRCE